MPTKKICQIDGCDKPSYCRGWCAMHFQRWKKHGDPLKTKCTPKGASLQFVKDAAQSETDECIEWPFYVCKTHGYGAIRYNGRNQNAHRVALTLATNESPKDKYACHTCHNRLCVNPHHLYWGTPTENSADKLKDGTHNRGAKHGNNKLNEDQIRSIRADTKTQRAIADEYGITQTTVSRIKTRKNWAWLD